MSEFFPHTDFICFILTKFYHLFLNIKKKITTNNNGAELMLDKNFYCNKKPKIIFCFKMCFFPKGKAPLVDKLEGILLLPYDIYLETIDRKLLADHESGSAVENMLEYPFLVYAAERSLLRLVLEMILHMMVTSNPNV